MGVNHSNKVHLYFVCFAMSLSFKASENPALAQSLTEAIDLGLISAEQAQLLCDQHNEEEIMLIIDQIVSDQMETGSQCIGGHCTI